MGKIHIRDASRTLVSSIMAGVCIALGGMAFLSLDNRIIGAFIFCVGLFTICSFEFHLFTGKVCYAHLNDLSYSLMLPVIWLGNLAGTGAVALMIKLSRAEAIAEKAKSLVEIKNNDSLLSLLILGFFCNVFIYIAVEGFKSIENPMGKYLALIFGVMGFILCGTEHCVADMFYYWMSGVITLKSIISILVITVGNSAGGLCFSLARTYLKNNGSQKQLKQV